MEELRLIVKRKVAATLRDMETIWANAMRRVCGVGCGDDWKNDIRLCSVQSVIISTIRVTISFDDGGGNEQREQK